MTNLTKTEKVIAGVALSAISVFIFMFFQISKSSGSKLANQFETAHSINYKMARPEQVYSEYTLNGRELDQSYEALTPEQKKVANKKKQARLLKELTKKKKDEVKKKQIAAATAKAQVMAKTRAQVAAAARESVKAKAEYKKVTSDRAQEQAYANQNYNNATPAPATEEAGAKAPVKKSFAEWRALLLEKPTSENFAAFLTAYRKNEVTMIEYQAMAQDLLDQTDVKLKGLGLQALRSVPSFQSYSQLVHIQGVLPENLQVYAENSIMEYLQPQNLGYMNQALASSDKVVLLKSLTLLSANLEKLNQGDASSFSDPRTRGASNSGVTMSTFRTLLPSLGAISTSQDQELAALANSLVALINQSNNVATN